MRTRRLIYSVALVTAVAVATPAQALARPTEHFSAAPLNRAAYLEQVAAQRADERFVLVGTHQGGNGIRYHAYERSYRGLPVIGGDFVLVTEAVGTNLNQPLVAEQPIRIASTTPALSASQARRVARGQLREVNGVSAAQLVVFSPKGEQALAYEVIVTGRSGGRPSKLHVVVDAASGGVLASWDEVLAGTGRGYYYDGVTIDTSRTGSGYSLTDPQRADLFCGIQGNGAVTSSDDSFGNGSGTDLETACADAYYAAQQEWNMMRDWLGRDGWDGNGRGFPLFVGLNQVNAYWNGHTVNIGRTDDSLRQLSVIDIVAHEFGHAVFQYTPGGFDGYTETYALNEANGDIFGALTEHYANHPDDAPDFVFAEEADAFGRGPERIMYDPAAGPRDEPNCYSSEIPDTEVHDAAGPANHWFYLVAEGSNPGGGKPSSPICAGGPASVSGLGIQTAGRIWMTALMQKTSFWEYADARVATMNAVTQLFPGDCAKFDTVKGAWDAVSVPPQAGEPQRPGQCGDPADDFSVSVSPPSGSADPGGSVTATVGTATTSGDAQLVTLSASGLPSGATAGFEPPSVTSGGSSTLSIATEATTPAGTYQVTITGTGTSGSRFATYQLTVNDNGDPGSCAGFDTIKTGSLASGASEYQPDGSYFYTNGSGMHRACLDGPDGTDFDLYLQKWSGYGWSTVARSTTSGPDESLSYTGTAGYYRYRIHAYSGSGDYTLGYDTP